MNPGIVVPGVVDGNGLIYFTKYMRERGVSDTCSLTGSYVMGLHELVMKQEFFKVIRQHKRMAFELFTYYKPKYLIDTLKVRYSLVSLGCWIYCGVLSILGGLFLFFFGRDKSAIELKKIATMATVFLLASWVPSIFAYACVYSGDDFWMLNIYTAFAISMGTYMLVMKLRQSSFEKITETNINRVEMADA
jgi:hypothetical protein